MVDHEVQARQTQETAPPASDAEILQILSTEHWSLLATRSLTWNEVFSRTGMFFTVLSGGVVALALIAQATGFDSRFRTFALVLLPVVLFVGITSFFRVVAANNEDGRWVIGMNRLRAAYVERHPELARFFITAHTDDPIGIGRTMNGSLVSFTPLQIFLWGFTTTPATLATVASVVAGSLAGTISLQVGGTPTLAVVLGIAVFVVVLLLLLFYQFRSYIRSIRTHVPMFPPQIPSTGPQEPVPPSQPATAAKG